MRSHKRSSTWPIILAFTLALALISSSPSPFSLALGPLLVNSPTQSTWAHVHLCTDCPAMCVALLNRVGMRKQSKQTSKQESKSTSFSHCSTASQHQVRESDKNNDLFPFHGHHRQPCHATFSLAHHAFVHFMSVHPRHIYGTLDAGALVQWQNHHRVQI